MLNKLHFNRIIVVILLMLLCSSAYVIAEIFPNPSKPGCDSAEWATPIERNGLPNLHKVTDDLYRGAQPTAEGMKELEKMGIKTVVNLRSFHSDRDELEGTNLDYVHIYEQAWHVEEEELIQFLKIVMDPNRTPVFVHCQHGADRTGTMVAVYRIVVCGWNKEQAIKEMTGGGFGFHKIWQNLIQFIEGLDIEAIKKEAGIE